MKHYINPDLNLCLEQLSSKVHLIWPQLQHIRPIPNALTAGIASTLKDLYMELKAFNVGMSSDAFLVFLLQASIIASNAVFKGDFKQQIELGLQWQEHKGMENCPMFASLIHLFNIFQQQYLLGSHSSSPVPSNDQLAISLQQILQPMILMLQISLPTLMRMIGQMH